MPAGLYLHYPFCPYLCNYCDYFKSLYSKSDEKAFFEALRTETQLVAKEFPDSKIETIFIGGGTPSLAKIELLENWLKTVREVFDIADDAEFSIECNPDSVSQEYLAALKDLGVTRPNFGIQTFDTDLLRSIGRGHTPHQIQEAIYFANVLGFKSYGVDLLFGLPRQTSAMLKKDLSELVDLAPPHISFYQLTLEEGTQLYADVNSGKVVMTDDSLVSAMFRIGCDKFLSAGYEHYEIASFAKEGQECRHSLNYWQGGEVVGLGPSAHSYIHGRRFANVESISKYIESLKQNEIPRIINEPALLDRADETIISSLRLRDGVDRIKFEKLFGLPLQDRLDSKVYQLLVDEGLLIDDKSRLRLSDEGFFLADEIALRLLK
ncbi:MAG: radical SAM family heme chaperone HemW [candidate division Zixibacteria bacterium]|nr:radical SAM family heme chaperone HemW [candidate division Zixibacteria bacterium]